MATFKDSSGKAWNLAVNVGGIKRVKEATGLLITGMPNGMKGLGELTSDPPLFCTVCFYLIAPADRVAMDEQAFADLLDGPTVDAMGDAFLTALADFFPRQKAALLKVMEKGRKAMDLATAHDQAKIDAVTPEQIFEAMKAQAIGLASKSTPTAGNSPASVASETPAA